MNFNVAEFDRVARTFYEGEGPERQLAERRLVEFRNDPNSWQVADFVLEQSTYMNTKFLVFDILEEFVKIRWNMLPEEQRFILRNSIANLVVRTSSKGDIERSHTVLLRKMNGLLVQIVVKECPKYWPTFIEEIVHSSYTNVNLCINNMQIIKLISEELYGQARSSLTQAKTRKLKRKLIDDFALIFDLLKRALLTPTNNNGALLITAMETLREVAMWMPSQYAIQSDLLDMIYTKLHQDALHVLAMQCFNSVVGSHSDLPHETVAVMYRMISPEINRAVVSYQRDNDPAYLFIKEAATFLVFILSKYMACVQDIDQALLCLINICRIPDNRLLELCVDFWNSFLESNETCSIEIKGHLTSIFIERMVMPNKFLRVEFDHGVIDSEFVEHSDTGAQYLTMNHTLRTLSRQNPLLVQTLIHEKLASVSTIASDELFCDTLFRASWSLTALSEVFEVEQEKNFISRVIQSYTQLLQCRGNLDRIIMCCVFYVSSHYTHFLLFCGKFANLVWEKIFSYMQEADSDIKNMACYTLLKISKNLRNSPVEQEIPVQSLVSSIGIASETLQPYQIYMTYKAAANIICIAPISSQQEILYLLMSQQNQKIGGLTFDNSALLTKTTLYFLKVNIAVCKAAGDVYSYQLAQIVAFITECYSRASVISSGKNRENNEELFSNVKQSILELMKTFVLKSSIQFNMAEFQSLLQVVLADYYRKTSEREPKVLSLLSALVEKTEDSSILNEATQVALVHTLPMITQNFSDYPEIREQFYLLLKSISQKRFQDIVQEPMLLQKIIDSVLWGTKHALIAVSHTALEICLYILDTIVEEEEDLSSLFFETYYVRILTEVLEIMVDPDLRSGFEYQSQILAKMLMMVQEGEIYTRVFNPEQVSNPLMSNIEFLQQYVLDLLTNAFPMLQKSQIEVFVLGMFNYSNDLEKFQEDIEDFLVDITTIDEASVGQERLDEEKTAENDLIKNL